MLNVFAFTERTPASGIPAFISLNIKNPVPEAKTLRVLVRNADNGTTSEITLSREQALEMASKVTLHFGLGRQPY